MEITKWMEKVITCLKRSKPLAGRGIIIEETPLGSRIHSKAKIEKAGGGTTVVKLVIGEQIEESNMQYWAVYYNLTDDVETAESIDCIASLMVEITDEIPAGTIVFGFDSGTTLKIDEETYPLIYFDISRWLDETEP